MVPFARSRRSPMPGFGLGMGITLGMVSLVVILPIAALVAQALAAGPRAMLDTLASPRVGAALWLSFRLAFLAALFNLVFGTLTAWVLARYRFAGRRLVDALVDLPFALPTAVAGIALTALYAPTGPLGGIARDLGWRIAYAPAGILIALIFVGLPFVIRTIQPVIAEIEPEVEEASATLDASRLRTLRRVVLPTLMPAALTGFARSLARAINLVQVWRWQRGRVRPWPPLGSPTRAPRSA